MLEDNVDVVVVFEEVQELDDVLVFELLMDLDLLNNSSFQALPPNSCLGDLTRRQLGRT